MNSASSTVGFDFDPRIDWTDDLFELVGPTSPHRLWATPGMCAALPLLLRIVHGQHEQHVVWNYVSGFRECSQGHEGSQDHLAASSLSQHCFEQMLSPCVCHVISIRRIAECLVNLRLSLHSSIPERLSPLLSSESARVVPGHAVSSAHLPCEMGCLSKSSGIGTSSSTCPNVTLTLQYRLP